jgi:hypothetical protein
MTATLPFCKKPHRTVAHQSHSDNAKRKRSIQERAPRADVVVVFVVVVVVVV